MDEEKDRQALEILRQGVSRQVFEYGRVRDIGDEDDGGRDDGRDEVGPEKSGRLPVEIGDLGKSVKQEGSEDENEGDLHIVQQVRIEDDPRALGPGVQHYKPRRGIHGRKIEVEGAPAGMEEPDDPHEHHVHAAAEQ